MLVYKCNDLIFNDCYSRCEIKRKDKKKGKKLHFPSYLKKNNNKKFLKKRQFSLSQLLHNPLSTFIKISMHSKGREKGRERKKLHIENNVIIMRPL